MNIKNLFVVAIEDKIIQVFDNEENAHTFARSILYANQNLSSDKIAIIEFSQKNIQKIIDLSI